MFVEASMRKKQAEIERNRFATSRVRTHVQKFVPPKVVEVQVERESCIVVCTAKVFVDKPDIFEQVACQVTKSLNEPYGKGRQGGVARPWEARDFELFCGHNFEDQALLSKDSEQAREQVHQLAGTFGDTPLVVLRKSTAVWVNVEVRQIDLKVRIVRDVRPKSHAHILWSCFPDGKHHKDYKIMIDNHQDFRDTFRGYLCDASRSVVVEPRTEASLYLRFDPVEYDSRIRQKRSEEDAAERAQAIDDIFWYWQHTRSLPLIKVDGNQDADFYRALEGVPHDVVMRQQAWINNKSYKHNPTEARRQDSRFIARLEEFDRKLRDLVRTMFD